MSKDDANNWMLLHIKDLGNFLKVAAGGSQGKASQSGDSHMRKAA
jgi:hypothetical protein